MFRYAVYPQCITVDTLAHAMRLAAEASTKPENDYRARVESCDLKKTMAEYRHGHIRIAGDPE